MIDSLIDAPKIAHPRIYERLELLEAQKADLETQAAKMRIAAGIRCTKQEVLAWMKQFCNGDPLDMAFRRRIIDVFINCVYLYNGKTVIYYNIRGDQQISFIEPNKEPRLGNCLN